MTTNLEQVIDAAWENRTSITSSDLAVRNAVNVVLSQLDSGERAQARSACVDASAVRRAWRRVA